MKKDTAEDSDPVIRRLKTLAKYSPYLKDAAGLYEAILPLLRDARIQTVPASLTAKRARSKMETGVPLLHYLDLELEVEAVHKLMLQLACRVEKFYEGRQEGNNALPSTQAARRIRELLEENKLNIIWLLSSAAAGGRHLMTSASQSFGIDAGLLWILTQNALRPALRAWRRQLTPIVEGISWYKGSCFVCGADATLGEFQGNNQVKHLRCIQCGADWPFRRLQCMYCDNEDHTTLGYLYPESQREKLRVEVCEKCKGYLKVITTFSATQPEMLPVEDLATLHLDYIAQERGYVRQACSEGAPN